MQERKVQREQLQKKLPSWHLTGNKTMLYVKEANTRGQKKKER